MRWIDPPSSTPKIRKVADKGGKVGKNRRKEIDDLILLAVESGNIDGLINWIEENV